MMPLLLVGLTLPLTGWEAIGDGRSAGSASGVAPTASAIGANPSEEAKTAAEKAAAAAIQGLPETRQLILAYAAVFRGGGPDAETDDGIRVQYERGKIIWLDRKAVLLVPGLNLSGSPDAAGILYLFYLRSDGRKFTHLAQHALAGADDGSPPEWQILDGISDQPVILSTASTLQHGYYCATTTLTELGDDAPTLLVSFGSVFDNSENPPVRDPVQSIEGKIANVKKNSSFDVVFEGTRNFTHHFRRNQGGYVRVAGNPQGTLSAC